MTGEARVPERAIARLRPHARALVVPAIALIVIVGAASYGAFALDETWQVLAVLLGAVVAAGLLWVLPLLRWLSTQYLITTRRIVLRRGLLVRTRQEVLLSRSFDVSLRRSGLQSAFRSGDVLVNTGLDRPVVLRDLPRADLVLRALGDVMEASTTSITTVRRPVDATDPATRRTRTGR
ncbi:PH domain-containing protein [Microcella sp.]|uniref:PH domain-containing protein n=1 Tax=Microcella sp. TaxID=1913979 RepID=UPI00391A6C36